MTKQKDAKEQAELSAIAELQEQLSVKTEALADAERRIQEVETLLRDSQQKMDKEIALRVEAEGKLAALLEGKPELKVQKATVPTPAPQVPEPTGPLTPAEEQELAELEARARKPRQLLMPTPHEMIRLGKLRTRSRNS